MATELSADVIDRWQGLLSDFHADSKEVARHRERDARRAEVVKEMQAQLVEFLEPGSTTPEFRAVFDKKTRHEWDVFGLKGLSGAMFLNKLVKHIPDQAELASQLREVLPAPSDESRARPPAWRFSGIPRWSDRIRRCKKSRPTADPRSVLCQLLVARSRSGGLASVLRIDAEVLALRADFRARRRSRRELPTLPRARPSSRP